MLCLYSWEYVYIFVLLVRYFNLLATFCIFFTSNSQKNPKKDSYEKAVVYDDGGSDGLLHIVYENQPG